MQRLVASAYADDPINWLAALPTPAASNSSGDSDLDGMPDEWELTHGTDPSQNDGQLDNDGDGRSNYEEYVAGTDPSDPASQLTINIRLAPSELAFNSAIERVYTVQASATLTGAWSNVGAEIAGNGSAITIPLLPNESAKFYRVLVRRN